jgi:hypothetical protein
MPNIEYRPPPQLCPDIHCKKWFKPVTVFTPDVLQYHIAAMEAILALPPLKDLTVPNEQPIVPEVNRHMESYTQNMPKYNAGELTNDLFLEKWRNREPFVLTGIVESTKPEELLDLKRNRAKHCMTSYYDDGIWHTRRSTLGSYFKVWERDQLPKRSLQIRVCRYLAWCYVSLLCSHEIQDYPPKSDLKKVHPGLYDTFISHMEQVFGAYVCCSA